MSRRIIIEDDCPDHGEGCGRRLILTAPSPEMVERAVSALRATRSRNGWTLTDAARAALTAALFGEEE